MAKTMGSGGRPVGVVVPRVKRREKNRTLIETDAEQLRIKLEIDNKYAGRPDTGRVIPKGSEEFERIAAELLARENKDQGVVFMGTKGKLCDEPGCDKQTWKAGKCWAHHPEHVAKRESKAAAVSVPVVVAALAPAVPATKKNWRVCSVPGCDHFVTRKRLCWSHLKERGIDPKSGKALVVEAPAVAAAVVEEYAPKSEEVFEPRGEQVSEGFCDVCGVYPCSCLDDDNFAGREPAEVEAPPEGFGKVVNAAGDSASFGTDPVLLMALREAWAAKEAEWLVELSGLKPGKAVCFAAKMVEAVEGLGY